MAVVSRCYAVSLSTDCNDGRQERRQVEVCASWGLWDGVSCGRRVDAAWSLPYQPVVSCPGHVPDFVGSLVQRFTKGTFLDGIEAPTIGQLNPIASEEEQGGGGQSVCA